MVWGLTVLKTSVNKEIALKFLQLLSAVRASRCKQHLAPLPSARRWSAVMIIRNSLLPCSRLLMSNGGVIDRLAAGFPGDKRDLDERCDEASQVVDFKKQDCGAALAKTF